ncbi:hypothetical protein Tco_0454158 [Tanacetum coccineum]
MSSSGKRQKDSSSSKRNDKSQTSLQIEDLSTHQDQNLQGQAIQLILEDIQHDCDIATALQAQVDELMKSIDIKYKLLETFIMKDCKMARKLQEEVKELLKSVDRKEYLIEQIKNYYK